MQVTVTTTYHRNQQSMFSNIGSLFTESNWKSPIEILITVQKCPRNLPRYLYSIAGYQGCAFSALVFSLILNSKLSRSITANSMLNMKQIIAQNIIKALRSCITCPIILTRKDISSKILRKKNVLTSIMKMTVTISNYVGILIISGVNLYTAILVNPNQIWA